MGKYLNVGRHFLRLLGKKRFGVKGLLEKKLYDEIDKYKCDVMQSIDVF